MGSPVFGAQDRVDPPGGDNLPAELKGKSAAEIAAYYQAREAALRTELDTRPPASVTPPPEPPPPDKAEWWNDPNASVDKRIAAKALTKAEWDRAAASIRPSLIWMAKKQVMEKHADFLRVEKEVDTIMKQVPDFQQTDPSMWETVYIQAKGFAHERLSAEDRANPPTIIGEPGNPGGTAPPSDADLYKVTLPGTSNQPGVVKSAGRVADMLGVTHDQYRKSDKILQGDGLLPLTIDNRRVK